VTWKNRSPHGSVSIGLDRCRYRNAFALQARVLTIDVVDDEDHEEDHPLGDRACARA
jgi:hypothetical protein